jgi:hypothetical protein
MRDALIGGKKLPQYYEWSLDLPADITKRLAKTRPPLAFDNPDGDGGELAQAEVCVNRPRTGPDYPASCLSMVALSITDQTDVIFNVLNS